VEFKSSDGRFESLKLDTKYGMEHAFYASNTQQLTDKLTIEYGIRYSFFQNIGPGRVFKYENNRPDDTGEIIDTVDYHRLEHINFYHGPEPRVAARFAFNPSTSLKFSYTRMRQYLQVATNSTAGLPVDRWVASDKYIKPQIADQIALGLFKNFVDNSFETSAEIYYKKMQNQIDFKEEAEILFNNYLESEIRSGKAWAYGVELMVKKNIGKTTGWMSYTYSRTQRRINGINNGKSYSPRYDRPHNFSTVISHQLSKRISLSANWVFTSGSAVSFPKGTYEVEGRIVNYYEGRNQDRMPNYHRMDFSVNIDGKKKRKWQGSWNFSIYNVYSRKNPFTILFREVYNNNPQIAEDGTLDGEKVPITSVEQKPVKVYLFRLIPSISYNFKF
jgi:outer membrane receptor protein involved in Fe transport